MNKDKYLDKQIPDDAGEPDWFTVPDKDLSHLEWKGLTRRMHELQDRWNDVYRKIKKERLF